MIIVLPDTVDRDELRSFLIELDKEYERKASAHELHELDVDIIQSQCEISPTWYDSHIRKESKGLFQKFPVVKNSNNQAICPICESVFSTKITLEHIIPKSRKEKNGQKLGEPRLAILPINLVKCCEVCNTSKHSERSRIKEKSEINPYFEDFDIEDYFDIKFVDTNEGFWPEVEFIYKDNSNDKRIHNFIDNYNIKKTYNHRVKLEFQKILTILANNPLTISKSILKSYIEHLLDTYSKNSEFEKIDFSQTPILRVTLVNISKQNKTALDMSKFREDIQKCLTFGMKYKMTEEVEATEAQRSSFSYDLHSAYRAFWEIDKENYTEDVQEPINKESVSLLNKGQEKIIK